MKGIGLGLRSATKIQAKWEGLGYKNPCKTGGFWLQKPMQNGRVLATKMMDDVNERDRVREGFGYKNPRKTGGFWLQK